MKNNNKDFIYNKHNKKDTLFNTKGNLYDRVKNILSWVLIGCVLLSLVGSILGTIAFSKDCKTAKADTVDSLFSFDGSNLRFVATSYGAWNIDSRATIKAEAVKKNDGSLSYFPLSNPKTISNIYVPHSRYGVNDIMFSFRFEDYFIEQGDLYQGDDLTDVKIYYDFVIGQSTNKPVVYPYIAEVPTINLYNNNSTNDSTLNIPSLTENPYFTFKETFSNGCLGVFSNKIIGGIYDIDFQLCNALVYFNRSSASFNSDIYKIEVGNRPTTMRYYNIATSTISNEGQVILQQGDVYMLQESYSVNYVKYFSKNGEWLEISIPIFTQNGYWDDFYLYENRTYYTEQGGTGDTNAYWDGYATGKIDGVDEFIYSHDFEVKAKDRFYDSFVQDFVNSKDFYNTAYNRYHSVWFGEGVTNANDYTFFALVSAPVDAVLQGFFGNGSDDTGLLNFELLGINFKSLFSGLFTLAVILWIVKFVTQQKT